MANPKKATAPETEGRQTIVESPPPPPSATPASEPASPPKEEPKAEAKPEPKAAPAAKAPPPPAPAGPATRRYRVWAHGTLQRNDKTYQSGEELTLCEDEAKKISCLEPID